MGTFRGELVLRGSTYRSTNESEAHSFRLQMREAIATYLKMCPSALIIIDELELIHRHTISMLQAMLDSSFPYIETSGSRVSTAAATFIFISDFGAEGITQADDLDDVRTRIRFESERIWGDTKTASLIDHLIPFIPMRSSTDGAQRLTRFLIKRLPSLHAFQRWNIPVNDSLAPLISPDQETALVNYIVARSKIPLFQNDNYRAIPKIFSEHVDHVIVTAAQKFARDTPPDAPLQQQQLRLAFEFDVYAEQIRNVQFLSVDAAKLPDEL